MSLKGLIVCVATRVTPKPNRPNPRSVNEAGSGTDGGASPGIIQNCSIPSVSFVQVAWN
jgi:hypothetical protein